MEILKSLFKYFTMRMIEVKSQPQECTFKARPLNILPSERKFTKFYLDTHFIGKNYCYQTKGRGAIRCNNKWKKKKNTDPSSVYESIFAHLSNFC